MASAWITGPESRGCWQMNVRFANGGFAVRLGRPNHRSFSERYQGTRGIARRYWSVLGGRLTFVKLRAF